MSDHIASELFDTAATAATALAPSAAGATIATMIKRGLSWTERLVQIFVGIVVSWYSRIAIEAIFAPDPFLGQSIAFTIGLLACDALPRLRERAIARIGELPDAVADWISRRIGGPK